MLGWCWSGFAVAVLAVGVLAGVGCSSSKLQKSSALVIGKNSSINYSPGRYTFDIFIVDHQSDCTIAQTAKVLIDGVPFPFMYDCTVRDVAFGEDRGFTIRVEDEGDTAEMVVNGLAPGLSATFLSPANGREPAGGALTVSVPAVLQGLQASFADFAYLGYDDPNYLGEADALSGQTTGPTVQATAPTHPGRFTFWMIMQTPGIDPSTSSSSYAPATVTSCSGFADCSAAAVPMLGPLALEVVP
jgi:hypothetical protein